MKGEPKFKLGQLVKFNFGNEKKEGIIFIIDKFVCFEYPDDVSYDILNEKDNCLYKHVQEKEVYEDSTMA